MSFFESNIVQEEAKKLFNDYQELMNIGSGWGYYECFIEPQVVLSEQHRVE